MIKEARGFGSTIDEAKENAVAELNAAYDADIQFEIIDFPKKKTLGLFGGKKAQVRVFVELPDEKPKAQKKQRKKRLAQTDLKAHCLEYTNLCWMSLEGLKNLESRNILTFKFYDI